MFYKSDNIRNIPVPNVFLRTGIFSSFRKDELSQSVRRDEKLYYQESKSIKIKGANLSLAYDLPMLALIFHHYWIESDNGTLNKRNIEVPLDFLMWLKQGKKVIRRKNDCLSFVNSIGRLKSVEISILDKKDQALEYFRFFENGSKPIIDYKKKIINITLTQPFIDHYQKKNCTFINFEEYLDLPDQTSQALYIFLRSQEKRYIDFTLKKLCEVTGLNLASRKSTISKKREKIINAIRLLKEEKIIHAWHHYVDKQHYRLLSAFHDFSTQDIENIEQLKSNFKDIKRQKKQESLNNNLPKIFQE